MRRELALGAAMVSLLGAAGGIGPSASCAGGEGIVAAAGRQAAGERRTVTGHMDFLAQAGVVDPASPLRRCGYFIETRRGRFLPVDAGRVEPIPEGVVPNGPVHGLKVRLEGRLVTRHGVTFFVATSLRVLD